MIPFRARFKDMQISKSFLRIFSFSVYQGTYIAFFFQDINNFLNFFSDSFVIFSFLQISLLPLPVLLFVLMGFVFFQSFVILGCEVSTMLVDFLSASSEPPGCTAMAPNTRSKHVSLWTLPHMLD